MDDIKYDDRSDDELASLEQSFKAPGGPRNYVAAPAPGWDTRGIWHCFDSGSRSGYTAHAVGLHWALNEELKIPTQLVPHRSLDVDIERFPADRQDMLFEWHKQAVGLPELLVVSFPPETAEEMSGVHGRIVPYCAFEGDKVSSLCAQLCNGPAFAEVWVVSDFVRRSLLAGGVAPERVRTVTPLLCGGPYSMPALDAIAEARQRRSEQGEPFRFGVMGTWHSRKGFHQLVRAYWSRFSRSDEVELVVRTSNFGRRRTIKEFEGFVTGQLREIAEEMGHKNWPDARTTARIKLLTGTALTDVEVVEWISSLDCYVNPSYGEGLGIPQHWAKACDVPIVTSDWGAVGDLCLFTGGDFVFESKLMPVDPEIPKVSLMFDRRTQWGGYETAQLAHAMSNAFEAGRRTTRHSSADLVRQKFGVAAASTSAYIACTAVSESLARIAG